ncbi:MAG: hypothetical protein HYU43_06945 [Armatimonadetes bacterium]|nr:hypothetical protein [Nitrospirota bacterium]MBI2201662.1 hypothetical protein [Armatimonadota bacterium]
MPELEFFVVCESVSIDQATNQASVFNILEELGADAFPTIVPKCAALSLWRIGQADWNEDWQVILRVMGPGIQKQEFPANLKFRQGNLRHRVAVRLEQIPINGAGDLVFELLLNGNHVAQHVVSVLSSKPSPQPPGTKDTRPH